MADQSEKTDDDTQDTGSEAEALVDILTWSQGCPEWQRDALRRLCTKDMLDDADIDELTALCKNRGKGGIALAAGHVPDPQASTLAVNLRAVHSAENVNALKPGELLSFDKKGLTIVYGDNGSGKSGYARILKKVCRARMKEDRILPNIYAKEGGTQQATIEFSVDGNNKSENWTVDQPSDPLLSSISVFDSGTANVHVDEVNDVAYTPFPMRVLEKLATVSQQVKKRITANIRELKQQTPEAIMKPECSDDTAVGRLISDLGSKTKEQDVCNLATLEAKEKARLDTIKADLGTDPTKIARRVETIKTRLEGVATAFEALRIAASDEQVDRLTALYSAHRIAREAAAAAAGNIFADEPLPDIGSEVWRGLWEAARRYSEQQAYPETAFPFTGDGAHCVLCQQELGEEAISRLNRFERFVKDETKLREEQAAKAYRTALDELDNADVPASYIRAAVVLIRDELNDDELAQTMRRAAVMLKRRLRAVHHNHVCGAGTTFPKADRWPANGVDAHIDALSARITTLRAEDASEERKQLRATYRELADREWLAVVQDDVIAEIGRRKKLSDLERVLRDTLTNRITIKSGEIAERLVTNALRAQFSKEIDKLDVAGLAIELRKGKTSYGVPHFRVSLIRSPDARVGEILSEGEHRCVALAAFLAELATTESRSAIVFDDPVSSLDHRHRNVLAQRLAEEGQYRQIIVLTHDIAFLFLLGQACRESGSLVAFRSVTRNDAYAGFVQKDPPVRAQRIEKVIEGIQKQFDNEECFYGNGDQDKWERTVDALQKRLRATWERAVEEAVGPVIKRLSNKVETKGLAKVTILTMDDCKRMRQAYGRCSTLLHSTADALNPPLPKPDVVQNEITTLQKWVEDIQRRQGSIDYL